MKLIICVLLLLLAISCGYKNVEVKSTEYKFGGFNTPLKIVCVDSCQYLYGDWGSGQALTHKGNCKYCEIRRLKN